MTRRESQAHFVPGGPCADVLRFSPNHFSIFRISENFPTLVPRKIVLKDKAVHFTVFARAVSTRLATKSTIMASDIIGGESS